MYEEFCKIYQEHFSETYFGKLENPKISMTYIEKGINKFLAGMTEAKIYKFKKVGLWNLTYFFLGDLFNDLSEDFKTSLEWVTFSKRENQVKVNEEILFSVMMLFRRMIIKHFGSLKSLGLPKWMKTESYDKFLRDLRYILSRSDLREKLMRGRPKNCLYFGAVDDVFKFLKGSVTDEKILQVIDICKKRSPGWEKRKGFRTLKEFKKSVDLFYSSVKELYSDKKYRITKKKTTKYLMMLGLMATIQTRSNIPVSLHSAKEAAFFTFYEPFRFVARKLNWLELFDPTYCPGIRTKSFIVKIMCSPVKIASNTILLNKIEKVYNQLAYKNPSQCKEFAVSYSYNAFEYLRDRNNLFIQKATLDPLSKENKKLSFVAKEFGEKNGQYWKREKYNQIRINQGKKRTFEINKMNFLLTYSDPKTFFWMSNLPRMTA